MKIINKLKNIVGEVNVLTGNNIKAYGTDWTGKYKSTPLAVVRPSTVIEVSKVVKFCSKNNIAMVPVSGNTGLSGGTSANNSVMISLERLNKIKKINVITQTVTVEAGVILSNLHEAVETHNLVFPLTFGAKGSVMIGGSLSTNAGGSNVLKYGSTRTLCMGLEVVLPNGQIMNLMSELHKDNTGYALKDLFIGAEGTLGLITAAVLKLSPLPNAYATAMIATTSLEKALKVLNIIQEKTGGGVEAFEYMPKNYIETYLLKVMDSKSPFDRLYDINIMLEISTTVSKEGAMLPNGKNQLTKTLEEALSELIISEDILDAVIAQSESQRMEMWELREASAEITITNDPLIITDVAVPLDKVSVFIKKMDIVTQEIDPGSKSLTVAHLGDGNIHYAIYPTKFDEVLFDKLTNLSLIHI